MMIPGRVIQEKDVRKRRMSKENGFMRITDNDKLGEIKYGEKRRSKEVILYVKNQCVFH